MRTDRNEYQGFSAQREDFSRAYSSHRRQQRQKYADKDSVFWCLVSAIAVLSVVIFGL